VYWFQLLIWVIQFQELYSDVRSRYLEGQFLFGEVIEDHSTWEFARIFLDEIKSHIGESHLTVIRCVEPTLHSQSGVQKEIAVDPNVALLGHGASDILEIECFVLVALGGKSDTLFLHCAILVITHHT
jgi:hypothetical protein